MQRDVEREADCVSGNLTDLAAQLPRRNHSERQSRCPFSSLRWSFGGGETHCNP